MFAIDKFKFKAIKEKKDYGKYTLGPLPRGFGITLANSLRRILLSSIEGAAVTSVKVEGVKHEYSTLPGVMDDVLTILFRFKQLALKCYSSEPQSIELKVKGKKKVFAKNIKLTSEVEIANPGLEITELSDSKAKLGITLVVEKGAGYARSDESKRGQVGVIPLDANFSPVKRVKVDISKTRVGQQIDLDRFTLEIFTNSVISPKEALEQAVDLYHKITKRLVSVVKGGEEGKEDLSYKSADKAGAETSKGKEEKKKISPSSDLDIDKLNLSARLTNSLLKAGYKNLTELESKSLDEIMEIRGLGQRSAEELVEIMESYKLNVKE